MAKEGITGEANILAHYKKICDIVEGDVSAEVISTDYEGMVKEGEALAAFTSTNRSKTTYDCRWCESL